MILVSRHLADPLPTVEPSRHLPVLVDEVVQLFADAPEGALVDATVGGGGHALALLEAMPERRLVALDRDLAALQRARQRLEAHADRVHFVHAPFSSVTSAVESAGCGPVAGIVADFGLSSDQIEDPDRGFSFQADGPLDMRMDRTTQKTSAAVLLAEASEDELERWLREYGEERFSRRLAHAIVHQRRFGPILRTSQLVDVVERALPRGRPAQLHPATRTFQALRIAVNRELDEIDAFLHAAPGLLAPGGRLAAISFHSLEDRRVKRAFRDEVRGGAFEDLLPRGITPAPSEVRRNPRARSARMRAVARRD